LSGARQKSVEAPLLFPAADARLVCEKKCNLKIVALTIAEKRDKTPEIPKCFAKEMNFRGRG